LFHSDRGSQYASGNFGKTLAAHGFAPSRSRKGNCWNNAVAESFFATLKNEEVTGVYDMRQRLPHRRPSSTGFARSAGSH
jgi:transposase InsO family protein